MAKHLKHSQSKNGTVEKDRITSPPIKQEISKAANDGEVECSQKASETGSEINVIIEELDPSSADIQAEGIFDEELQPAEGTVHQRAIVGYHVPMCLLTLILINNNVLYLYSAN